MGYLRKNLFLMVLHFGQTKMPSGGTDSGFFGDVFDSGFGFIVMYNSRGLFLIWVLQYLGRVVSVFGL